MRKYYYYDICYDYGQESFVQNTLQSHKKPRNPIGAELALALTKTIANGKIHQSAALARRSTVSFSLQAGFRRT